MKRTITIIAFSIILLVVGYLGYKIVVSIIHNKQTIDSQRTQEELIIEGLNKDDLFEVLNNDKIRLYSQEYNPEFINDMGKKESIKELLETSNCTIDCVHNYSEPIITYDNGNTKVHEYEVEGNKYYLIKCKNNKDYIIGKEYKNLRKLC